jgi:AcrR family transcriptional regulator
MKGNSISKKDQILDAAEELFAIKGYIDVTLKEIVTKAGADIPLLNYHFKNKVALLEGVLSRRAHEINTDRLKLLDQARKSSGNKSPEITPVMEALFYPMVGRCINGSPEWSYYAMVIGQLAFSRQFANIIHDLYDQVAQHFISAMRLALPDASLDRILWGYQFSVSSMVSAIANTGRIDLMSESEYSSADLQSAYDHLIVFVTRGLSGL